MNSKVFTGILGSAVLVAPWLFGVEVASAAAYKGSKATKPEVTIAGTVYSGFRRVNTGETGRKYSNSMVGSWGDNSSYLKAAVSTEVNRWKLTGLIELSASQGNTDLFDQDNVEGDFDVTSNLEVAIEDAQGMLGRLSMGDTEPKSSSAYDASLGTTKYKGVGFVDAVNFGDSDVTVGSVFGYTALNSNGHHIEYQTADFSSLSKSLAGLTLTMDYSSQSDLYDVNYDSMGFGARYGQTVKDVQLDLRAGYSSRARESQAKISNNTNMDPHIHGLGLSAAFAYKGFDALIAHAKLDPKGYVNPIVDNSAANALTNNFGQKAAEFNSYAAGYKYNFMGKPVGVSYSHSTSKHWRNDGSKGTVKALGMECEMSDHLTFYGTMQEHSASGVKVWTEGAYAVPPKIKVSALGFEYWLSN